MAKNINPIVIATDTFASWITKTNQLVSALSTEIVTANTSVNGANTTGNTNLIGIFGANTVAVGNSLRGGTVNAVANLAITSNAFFSGANTGFSGNVSINNGATTVNSVSMTVTGPTLTIGSNTTFTGNVNTTGSLTTVSSNVLINGTNTEIDSTFTNISGSVVTIGSNTFTIAANSVTVQSNTLFVGGIEIANTITADGDIIFGPLGKQTGVVNTDIGVITGSPVQMYSWLKTEYKLADVTARVGNTTSTRASKMLIVNNTANDVYLTEYAVLNAPVSANLGLYTVSANTTHVLLRFTPNIANLSMNLNITLTA